MTLDAALAEFPGIRFDLEVKNHPADHGFEPDCGLALDVAARARAGDTLTSFHWPSVDAAKRAFPRLRTGLLIDASGGIDDAVAYAVERGHGAIAPHVSLVLAGSGTLKAARAAGLEVWVWTVDSGTDARRAVAEGATHVITDDPVALAEWWRTSP